MTEEKSREMVKACVEVMQEKKGEDIAVIDISEVSVIADYFVIVTAGSIRQIDALSDSIQDKMAECGYENRAVEGDPETGWVLLDYNDIIVHVFDREKRSFYDLEHIWSDGKKIEDPEKL